MIKAVYGVAQNGERVKLDFNEVIFVNDAGCEINVRTMNYHPDNLDLYMQLIYDSEKKQMEYFYMVPGACNLMMVKALKRTRKDGFSSMKGSQS